VRPSAFPNPPSKAPTLKQKCHPDRSEAQWRDLLFLIRTIESEWMTLPSECVSLNRLVLGMIPS
jgi:hypothetical protein